MKIYKASYPYEKVDSYDEISTHQKEPNIPNIKSYYKFRQAMTLLNIMDEKAKYCNGSIEADFEEETFELIIILTAKTVCLDSFDISDIIELAPIIDNIELSASSAVDVFIITVSVIIS